MSSVAAMNVTYGSTHIKTHEAQAANGHKPFRFVAVSAVAVSECGRYGLLPLYAVAQQQRHLKFYFGISGHSLVWIFVVFPTHEYTIW